LEWRSVKRTAKCEIIVSDLTMQFAVARITLTDRHSGRLAYFSRDLSMSSPDILTPSPIVLSLATAEGEFKGRENLRI